ncbi:hypothetical protein APHAL10511_004452 [Amanita phalloides]|nr:hypothetical protein APHAL10511_004452 [Amanita phalloides]
MALNRPPTSKPRGTCKYYNSPRGCFAGDKCKFLHGIPQDDAVLLTPYDSAKTCRYYAQGYCRRGADCWFRHVINPNGKRSPESAEEDELTCSICLENPVVFGLLGGCSHVFCIQCLRQWRDPANKSGDLLASSNTKNCPMCRAPSSFITPSCKYWKDGEEGKVKAIQSYKKSMSRVACRYFQESKVESPKEPFCPFGKDCFYQHINDDGTEHVFSDGVDVCMKIRSRRHHSHHVYDYDPHFFGARIPLFSVELERSSGDGQRSRTSDTLASQRRGSTSDVDAAIQDANEETRRSMDLIEHVHLMAEHFIASFAPSLARRFGERWSSPPRQDTPLPPLEQDNGSSSAFQRINQNDSMIIDIDDEQANGSNAEPPFVTDGRGRVVWSAVNESSDVQ